MERASRSKSSRAPVQCKEEGIAAKRSRSVQDPGYLVTPKRLLKAVTGLEVSDDNQRLGIPLGQLATLRTQSPQDHPIAQPTSRKKSGNYQKGSSSSRRISVVVDNTSRLTPVNDATSINPYDEFPVGSILRVKLVNFVTYEWCEFSPGPHLNMVVGPNGTGKSSIVCALALGLAGGTSILGRAKNISDYVRYGAESATIELELKCNLSHLSLIKQSPRDSSKISVVLRREFSRDNNASRWYMNEHLVTQQDVLTLVQALHIQVDNLCQFLPQDRVAEFARMSAPTLLRETELASAQGEELIRWHDELIALGDQHRTTQSQIDAIGEQLTVAETRYLQLSRDVSRVKERSRLSLLCRVLERKLQYAQYRSVRRRYDVAEADYRQLKEEQETFAATIAAPVEERRTRAERLYIDNEKQHKTLSQQMTDKRDTIAHLHETTYKDLQNQLTALKNKKKSLESQRATLQESVHHARTAMNDSRDTYEQSREAFSKECLVTLEWAFAQLTSLHMEDAVQRIRASLTAEDDASVHNNDDNALEEPKALKAVHRAFRVLLDHASSDKASIDGEMATIQSGNDDLRRESRIALMERQKLEDTLHSLEDARLKLLGALQRRHPDLPQVVQWLSQNASLFEQQVYEPILLHLQMKALSHSEHLYAQEVESQIPERTLSSFVCQSQRDMEVFLRETRDRHHWHVNVICTPTVTYQQIRNDPGAVDILQRCNQLGFEGVLVDAVEAPEAILRVLCATSFLHCVPVTKQRVDEERLFSLLSGGHVKLLRCYFADGRRVFVSHSRYGRREASLRIAALKQLRFLDRSLSSEQQALRDSTVRRRDDVQRQLQTHDAQLKRAEARLAALVETRRQADVKEREVRSRQMAPLTRYRDIEALYRRWETSRDRYQMAVSTAERASSSATMERQLQTCQADYQRLSRERSKLFSGELITSLSELRALFERDKDAILASFQHRGDYEQAMDELREIRLTFTRAEEDMRSRKEQLSALKRDVQRCLLAVEEVEKREGAYPPADGTLERELFDQATRDAAEEEKGDLETVEASVEAALTDARAKLAAAMISRGSDEQDARVLREVDQCARQVDTLKEDWQRRKETRRRLYEMIREREGVWREALDRLRDQMNNSFSEAFARIATLGELEIGLEEEMEAKAAPLRAATREAPQQQQQQSLTEEELDVLAAKPVVDYRQYGMHIRVKFRVEDDLHRLTAHRQSGGERSVSTILYLMALQQLAQSPFRVVDEINQGMDPINERRVHKHIVHTASQPGTPQYFLITPKLLPNLDYNSRMKVLFVYNGQWQPSKTLWDTRQFLTRREERTVQEGEA